MLRAGGGGGRAAVGKFRPRAASGERRWTLRGAVVRFHRPESIDSSRGQGGVPRPKLAVTAVQASVKKVEVRISGSKG